MKRCPDAQICGTNYPRESIFYQCMRIGVPRTLAGRLFYRTISSDELCPWDQATGELVLKTPLPVVAMIQSRKFINSYKIKEV